MPQAAKLDSPINGGAQNCSSIGAISYSSSSTGSRQGPKKIVIDIMESPGSGNIVNAKHIWEVLRKTHTVHIAISTQSNVVSQVFTESFEPAMPDVAYDLRIVPGWEKKLPLDKACSSTSAVLNQCRAIPRILNLPPPFCEHLFHAPCFWKQEESSNKGVRQTVELSGSIPFLPVSTVREDLRQMENEPDDYQGLKTMHFPHIETDKISFIVTYINLANITTTVFKDYSEYVIIINFGKYKISIPHNEKVVSIGMKRLPLADFERCLYQCTTIYPAITDGANTVGSIQALELPYYDLSFQRILNSGKSVAFLNEDGPPKLKLFEILKSQDDNALEFAQLSSATSAYYDACRSQRAGGRGAKILSLINRLLM